MASPVFKFCKCFHFNAEQTFFLFYRNSYYKLVFFSLPTLFAPLFFILFSPVVRPATAVSRLPAFFFPLFFFFPPKKDNKLGIYPQIIILFWREKEKKREKEGRKSRDSSRRADDGAKKYEKKRSKSCWK